MALDADYDGQDTEVEMPAPAPTSNTVGDAEAGKRAAAICSSCHTFDKGGADGIGPNLWCSATITMSGARQLG